MSDPIRIDGELYLSLETIASIYEIQIVWLEQAFSRGLFGPGANSEGVTCLAAAQLDFVATVVRMHKYLDADLTTITRQLSLYECHWHIGP